nr:MAG TPA: hypothetical protein [Caudoviricetes sp.]
MLIISNHLLFHLLWPIFNPFAALRIALRRGVEMPMILWMADGLL